MLILWKFETTYCIKLSMVKINVTIRKPICQEIGG